MLRTLSEESDVDWGRPFGLAATREQLYVSDERKGAVRRLDAAGHAVDVAVGLRQPQGIAVADGRLFVCETGRGQISAIDLATGKLENAWSNIPMPTGIDADASTVWAASGAKHAVFARDLRCKEDARVVAGIPGTSGNMKHELCGDGGPATAARLFSPGDVSLRTSGEILIADSYNGRIRAVSPRGTIRTICGGDQTLPRGNRGPALGINIGQPRAIASTAQGTFVAANPGIVWEHRDGEMVPVAGTWVDGFNDAEGCALEIRLNCPCGLTGWGSSLAIADSDNHRVCLVALSS
eukprot:gnl/TRDRNA2_/TRDRNA2_82264_c0_seq1.p1 gnl/TRDRNA2_/TRDRNA2_82264_c0~~gnl/TRDRNA2_/TRDRNA2_82264_c0_seq1.p1  ORF type:complete len:295 (-),score=41.27 gnl/TRDRNA2_/TRDRNA2_82264_c0_seq1:25-909(-)